MQDEHFQRDWTAAHDRFADGIALGLDKLAALLSVRAEQGQELLVRARMTTRAVLVGAVSGLTAGAALLATAGMAPPASASATHAAVHVYTGSHTLA